MPDCQGSANAANFIYCEILSKLFGYKLFHFCYEKNLIDVWQEKLFVRINFNMSGSLMKLSRVVAHRNLVVASRSFAQIKAGDLGLLAEQSRASQRAMFKPK